MRKSVLILIVVLFLTFGLAGCNTYSSHYYTIAHGTTNNSDSASVFFGEFTGTEVFKMKIKNGKTAKIQYSGKLEDGSLTVYYDCKGMKKTELFSLQGGDDIKAFSERLTAGTVYIIMETSDKCQNGACSFEIIYN